MNVDMLSAVILSVVLAHLKDLEFCEKTDWLELEHVLKTGCLEGKENLQLLIVPTLI